MTVESEPIIAGLRQMVAEEMFLLGQEVEDSLDPSRFERLEAISAALDEACEILNRHRAAGRGDGPC